MKTTLPRLLFAATLVTLLCAASERIQAADPDPAPPQEQPQPAEEIQPPGPAPTIEPPAESPPAVPEQAVPATAEPPVAAPQRPDSSGTTGRSGASSPRANTLPAPPETAVKPVPPGERGLRMNFRGVPLEMVLNYLSDAAGFVINLETDVRGKVDVWSNQPMNQEEALELLNTVLSRHGFASLRNGRTLTIVSREDAKKRDIPVVSGNVPDKIPRSEEIVTQIIPVRYISATQLTRDLQGLLPSSATMTANEGGNALVITDSQTNIRRMAEIVQALDTAVASVSSISVFRLQYADAKTLATTIQGLFQNQDSSRNNQGGQNRFFNQFRGGGPGGPGGGFPGGGGGGETGSSNNGRAPSPRVTAVADERSNSIVVSAPEEQMSIIEGVVKQIDRDVDDITELRVFRLKHADPQETADLLSGLFEDSTSSQNQGRRGQQIRFGGPGGFGGFGGIGGGRGAGTEQSTRAQAQTRVVAVPDMRTSSVVVSASKELMEQIARMVEQLDSDPARKQKVFVYSVENTDPEAVQQILQNLFPEQNNSNLRSGASSQRQNANQLNNRTTRNNNQGNQTGRTSAFGGAGGGGGTGFTGNQGR